MVQRVINILKITQNKKKTSAEMKSTINFTSEGRKITIFQEIIFSPIWGTFPLKNQTYMTNINLF